MIKERGLLMKKVDWVGAILGAVISLPFGFIAHNALVSITDGLWSIEEGAPWIAIYAVFIVPVICGFSYGLAKGTGVGLLAGVVSPFITAFIDYFACIIIGIFLSGSALETVIGIILLCAIFAGPGRIIIVIFEE